MGNLIARLSAFIATHVSVMGVQVEHLFTVEQRLSNLAVNVAGFISEVASHSNQTAADLNKFIADLAELRAEFEAFKNKKPV